MGLYDEGITPALSPEEWRRGEVHEGKEWWGCNIYADEDSIEFDDGIDPQHGAGFRERRHAVAALALYGQPYGFTWADVDLLRGTAAGYESGDWGNGLEEHARACHHLAARIADLLPPRELEK